MAGRITASTERALLRHESGQTVTASALAERIDPSTLFRALRRRREIEPDADRARARIVIAGAGALGREVMGWLRLNGRAESIVFLDDRTRDATVLCSIDDYAPAERDELLVAVADPAQRERTVQRLRAAPASFTAASATVGRCSVGAGSLLLPHCLVSADAVLGACVIVNTYSSIGHDVVLGDYCTLSSHVDLTGRVRVGARVLFGSGARVLPGLTIGDDAVIGAGAVVVRDVPAGATVFGVPARQIT